MSVDQMGPSKFRSILLLDSLFIQLTPYSPNLFSVKVRLSNLRFHLWLRARYQDIRTVQDLEPLYLLFFHRDHV